MRNILAVIPARGGSKGVRRKNLRTVGGIPLIAHAIREADKSSLITRCVISSDDEEIINMAMKHGGDVPFVRPAELATDSASTVDVLIHALNMCEKIDGKRYDYLVLLQPTTPLRNFQDIDQSLKLLLDRPDRNTVVTVALSGSCNPHYIYRLNEHDSTILPVLSKETTGKRRQDFEFFYIRNGAVYAVKRSYLLSNRSLVEPDTLAYVMAEERSINIDTELELFLADKLYEYLHKTCADH